MVQKQKIRVLLVAGLFFISLGGWLLHMRIHPISKLALNWVPFVAGLISVTAVTVMFLFRRTLAYAYVITGMLVIIGTITMGHFSFAHPPEHISFQTLVMGTMFPDIVMLFTNFIIGKALFELEMLKTEETQARHGRFFRYPNMGWWTVHLVALSAVYVLGHFLWK
jgi:cation transport ATPase